MSKKLKAKIFLKDDKILAVDEASIQVFYRSHYGILKGSLELDPVEALYLVNMRKIPCLEDGKLLTFKDLLYKFSNREKLFVRYNVFRDWRERGLYIQLPNQIELKHFGDSPVVNYPSKEINFPILKTKLFFDPDNMISFIFDLPAARKLFEDYWIGQLGVYKQHTRDKILKLDIFETLFLARLGYEVNNMKTKRKIGFDSLIKLAKKKDPSITALYDVYEDWRMRGYVVKTGFKFGSHFRIYFPGASPIKSKSKWIHSKHVLQVFPKDKKLKMNEWARSVRVAHGVRKTFIMAIPKMSESDYEKIKPDFVAYHRKRDDVEKPNKDNPRFIMVAISEDDEIDGKKSASFLRIANELGLSLIIAISDRETAVTYYMAKLINLPGSRNKYYEIEWFQP